MAGIEAHVCVLQTCIDMAMAGFAVFAVTDAMSSRSPASLPTSLRPHAHAGVETVNTEMGGVRTAGTGRNAAVQGLVCHDQVMAPGAKESFLWRFDFAHPQGAMTYHSRRNNHGQNC